MQLSTLIPLFLGGFVLLMFAEDSSTEPQYSRKDAPKVGLTQAGNVRVFTTDNAGCSYRARR